MKKIFSLFLAVVCCSMVFGQIISVTDGSLADWKNVPSEYLFKTECAPNAIWDGLKSVQVYVDMTYINLLVEVNDEVVTDREWTPFHVFINSDNSSSTGGYGGYGDLWMDADTDLMLETAIYSNGYVNPYNPGVFKWWGEVGGSGWQWTDPDNPGTEENGWGALVPEGSMPIGNAQMVDGKIEIQLDYTQIPMPFDETTFTLGFEIQQNWNSVGVLPNANEDETGYNVLAEKLRVFVHSQNNKIATINGIKYKVTSNAEPYTVEVISLLNKDASITEFAIPQTIALDGIAYTVTSIGSSAFSFCSSLTSVTIPNSVTSIENGAFHNCSSLTSVTIGNSVTSIGEYAFAGCSKLTSITIPNSVTSIGERAFQECTSLTSITIPNSVTSIGDYAFQYCYALNSVTIGNSVKSIGYGAFTNCSSLTSITIPNSVTSIGEYAFQGCTSLASIIIGNRVTSIGERVFLECTSLTSIVVEEGNTTYDSRDNCNAIIETATNTLIAGCQNTIIPNSVTSIGKEAFYRCSALISITIPNSVTSIGDYAFEYCYSLTKTNYTGNIASWCNIKFGHSNANPICYSNNLYINDQEIKDLVIPNTVDSIRNYAFYGCSGLTTVNIGNSVTSIGDYAFYGCSGLTTVNIPNSVTSIGYKAFEGTGIYKNGGNDVLYINNCLIKAIKQISGAYTINENTRLIAAGAFSNCSRLTSITIPNSVTSIGDYAFQYCYALNSVTIGNSVKSIGYGAFTNCSSLTSITIPNSVTSIGYGAFSSCSSLTSITIPNSVTSIGDWAFSWCSSLTSVTIGSGVTSIGEYAFRTCSSLTSITIPNSVTSIGGGAFLGCSSLTSITIPSRVTSIGNGAFRDCSSLTSITIPNSVTSIGSWAFDYCRSLTSVTIGNNVTSIGERAFEDCYGLTSVTCEAVNLPEMEDDVFLDVSTSAATLYVPEESLEKYKTAAQWKEFGTILPISQVGTDLENIGLDNGYEVMDNGKLLRNGQLIILRDGKEYNPMGVEIQ